MTDDSTDDLIFQLRALSDLTHTPPTWAAEALVEAADTIERLRRERNEFRDYWLNADEAVYQAERECNVWKSKYTETCNERDQYLENWKQASIDRCKVNRAQSAKTKAESELFNARNDALEKAAKIAEGMGTSVYIGEGRRMVSNAIRSLKTLESQQDDVISSIITDIEHLDYRLRKIEFMSNDSRERVNDLLERYPEITARLAGAMKWQCPINDPDCKKNCGSYGCGN
jgi:hypothetical protein